MEPKPHRWSKTVFRLRGIPNTVQELSDVGNLVSQRLGDVPVHHVHVFSLATTLNLQQSKVATIMFKTAPSIICRDSDNNEWHIPSEIHTQPPGLLDLTLDTHFMGMTPLNDVKSFSQTFDCIAVSGLASHPFGSWQPKNSDKTFMWIRDVLPNVLGDVRTVIYGYDTRLDNSRSFQSIHDLADELINHLLTYGWGSPSAKPVAFLAHSLGGLVVKEVLRKLASPSDEEYRNLLSVVRGAIFFGVPNLGMEQTHFRAIVQNNPNEALIDDIARNSNYLRRLNEDFSASSCIKDLTFFWAYETFESPTVVMTAAGRIDRDGPPAILVSPESATCRFIEINRSVTFPISATHSDMVKFNKESHYCDIIIKKLSKILFPPRKAGEGAGSELTSKHPQGASTPGNYNQVSAQVDSQHRPFQDIPGGIHSVGCNLRAELDYLKTTWRLTKMEEKEFQSATYATVEDAIREMQLEQERTQDLMYMQRLEPFLLSMQQFGEIANIIEIFSDAQHAMAYVWGPMKYVLCTASRYLEAFHSVLDAYQEVGEVIPRIQGYEPLFASKPYLKQALVMIYKDILWFHAETIRQLNQREWMQLFKASWRDFSPKIADIKENTARYRRSVESGVSFTDFETILALNSARASRTSGTDQTVSRQATVMQWLSPFDSEAEQVKYYRTRSVCKDPGRWLLDHHLIKSWFNPDCCKVPLLWLSGIPGAGKTILASIIVDTVRRVEGATVAFFYCKHGEESRNSFTSVSRSILAQILNQHPHLLPYFHEKASVNSGTVLNSATLAKEMLLTSLKSGEKTYIVIDGVDECNHDSRKEISSWFQEVAELPSTEMGTIRCLFVSQDDGIAVEDFRNIPGIKITDENNDDIRDFASLWHRKIEKKFGQLRKNNNIQNIISVRAQGMFIFAELFAKYLEDLPSREALWRELDPAKLPINLDHVYERILLRILESRGDHIVNHIRHILGWIVCARRPLQWREIQGAVCIDLENQHIDHDKEVLDTPKGLFASLVEIQEDDTVALVHGTAREYLISKDFVNTREAHYSLAMLSLSYLSFPQVDSERDEVHVKSDLLSGTHPFYDYASACWAIHLQEGIPEAKFGDKISDLRETLETFIELRWVSTSKPLPNLQRVHKLLSPLDSSKHYDNIAQAVGWAKRQSGKNGLGPSPDEALDLSQVTLKIRSVLENMHTASLCEADERRLQRFYGMNWFKCSRVNCYYYYQGFKSADQRDRHTVKHDRPFLCFIKGCPTEVFGCTTYDELKNHLFATHAIDDFEDADGEEFPDVHEEVPAKLVKNAAEFGCPSCDKKYTRKYTLLNHIRGAHSGEKPYECPICKRQFTRKFERDRHQRTHSEEPDKPYKCSGQLKDGTTWGCGKSFIRADKLRSHFDTKKGRKCVQPMMAEKLQAVHDGGIVCDNTEFGEKADRFLSDGESLPPFKDFLKLCGLDMSSIGFHHGETSLLRDQDGGNT